MTQASRPPGDFVNTYPRFESGSYGMSSWAAHNDPRLPQHGLVHLLALPEEV